MLVWIKPPANLSVSIEETHQRLGIHREVNSKVNVDGQKNSILLDGCRTTQWKWFEEECKLRSIFIAENYGQHMLSLAFHMVLKCST